MATNNKKKDIDVVDPSNYSADQLHALDIKTEHEKGELETKLKKTMKEIKGLLWLWWFLPVFGFLIYAMVYQHRLQKEENQEKTVLLKRAIAEKEIQLVLDKKRWEELEGKPENKNDNNAK